MRSSREQNARLNLEWLENQLHMTPGVNSPLHTIYRLPPEICSVSTAVQVALDTGPSCPGSHPDKGWHRPAPPLR